MALVGRVVLGFVIDRLEPRRASALSFLVQVAAIAVLARAEGAAVIYGACAVYGFSVGNNITLSPLIIQREYAAADFPAIVALSTAVVQILYAFGPGLLGVLRDAFGGYGVPLAVCLGAQPRRRGRDPDAAASPQLRNLRLFTTLSIILRGPWTPMPTKSSASAGAAATAARLSASLAVLNIASM